MPLRSMGCTDLRDLKQYRRGDAAITLDCEGHRGRNSSTVPLSLAPTGQCLGERALNSAEVAGRKLGLSDNMQLMHSKLLTSSDRNNDFVTSQEKLEWITPKISLMEAVETDGKLTTPKGERFSAKFGVSLGPS